MHDAMHLSGNRWTLATLCLMFLFDDISHLYYIFICSVNLGTSTNRRSSKIAGSLVTQQYLQLKPSNKEQSTILWQRDDPKTNPNALSNRYPKESPIVNPPPQSPLSPPNPPLKMAAPPNPNITYTTDPILTQLAPHNPN